MAAKRTIQYRGHVIRVWDKSYSIDGGLVTFVGDEPNVQAIKDIVDGMIAEEALLLSDRLEPEAQYSYYASIQLGIREPGWFEDLCAYVRVHAIPLAIAFAAGGVATLVSLIVVAWLMIR